MFRSRAKEDAREDQASVETPEDAEVRDPQAPKGRPTPKRREAEALRRAVVKPPANRKEAAKRAREARRVALAKQREALESGDERHLPARDKGAVRRFTRDFVDSRWNVAEFFLPIAVVMLVMSIMPSEQVRSMGMVLWMGTIVMIVFDSVLLRRRLKKALLARYPDETRNGATRYALMRSLQPRRFRLPRPQIKHGEAPR